MTAAMAALQDNVNKHMRVINPVVIIIIAIERLSCTFYTGLSANPLTQLFFLIKGFKNVPVKQTPVTWLRLRFSRPGGERWVTWWPVGGGVLAAQGSAGGEGVQTG